MINRLWFRTLDIGGDKHLDYYEFPEEMNPFLGYRDC
ncbi:MAG: putative PEP-binding protein [Erysipelotrichaceae bacterium]